MTQGGDRQDKEDKQNDKGLSPFGKMLKKTLNNCQDAEWLGEQSPLAAPYLLHDYLKPASATAAARGEALQKVLHRAYDKLQPGKTSRESASEDASSGKQHINAPANKGAAIKDKRNPYQHLIDEYFFHGRSVDAVKQELGFEKTQFHKHCNAAVEELGRVLITLLNPALRLEPPPRTPAHLWEREVSVTVCTRELAKGRTVSITGASGVGKTVLGSAVARDWRDGSIFWFTVRPGLNDQPENLLFVLAYFLSRRGQSRLWSELLAQAGKVSLDRAPGMIQDAIVALKQQKQTPLFCFDEVDRLDTTRDGAHHQVMGLIAAVHEVAPVLLIGAQADVKDVFPWALAPLSEKATQALLQTATRLSAEDRQTIAQNAQGNPRLIELAIAFCQYKHEDPALSLQQILANAQPANHLLEQLWPHLSESERTLLTELAVYRGPAPADVWRSGKLAAALTKLEARALVQSDETGGVVLSPNHRSVIYHQILSETRRGALHRQAAAVCQMRGLYTEATYHLVRAGDANTAILQWQDHKQPEINQGQAPTALAIFHEIRSLQIELGEKAQGWLASLCGELEYLRGDIDQALRELDPLLSSESVLGVQAHTLVGVIENDRSNFAAAEAAFDQALARAATLIGAQMAHIHKGLAWMHMRSRDLDKAWHEACLARAEAENIQGYVQELDCQYEAAEQHYLSALRLAEETGYLQGVAKICANLLGMYARRGQYDLAKRYLHQAEETTRQIGKLPDLPGMKINEAFILNLAEEHAAAFHALCTAMNLYRQMKLRPDPWPKALIDQGLAEAYLGRGELAKAKRRAERVIALGEGDVLPDALRTLGEVELAAGRLPDAERQILASLKLARESDPYLAAYALRALARVYLAMNEVEQASAASDEAIATFLSINLPNEVERTQRMIALSNT